MENVPIDIHYNKLLGKVFCLQLCLQTIEVIIIFAKALLRPFGS